MLRELRIEDFALVDRLSVEFRSGLCVVTGETGAGKTVLLEALALLLGGKIDRPPVREGAGEALVQGLFHFNDPSSFPFPDLLDEEGALLLERRIPREGRARAEANGRLISLSKLRDVGRGIADFHGQQERENLLDRRLQLSYLDAYARCDELRSEYDEALRALRHLRAERGQEERRIADARRQEEFLRWQAKEIDQVGLRPGEEEELEEEVRILGEAERLGELAHHVQDLLRESDGSATDLLGQAAERLARYADRGAELKEAEDACRRALVEVEEALLRVDRLIERIDLPPDVLEEKIARLERIAALKRKHKKSVEEILLYREEIAEEIGLLDQGEEVVRRLGKEEAAASKKLSEAAVRLSERRVSGAGSLAKEIEEGIQPLALAGGRFRIEIQRNEDEEGEVEAGEKRCRAGEDGIDEVEFLFAANRGEPLLPLRQVASGGEISRVMLAIKRVLADWTGVPTAVFDEIDAGVGGDVGERIGEALAEVGKRRQVLCITHLPSIASLGSWHLHVRKVMRKGRTVIAVEPLEGEARVEELVRMLGGKDRRSVSVPHAEEILRSAKKKK